MIYLISSDLVTMKWFVFAAIPHESLVLLFVEADVSPLMISKVWNKHFLPRDPSTEENRGMLLYVSFGEDVENQET